MTTYGELVEQNLVSPHRLTKKEIPSFLPDGNTFDMAAPDPREIDFFWIAKTLSKINRYNGRNKHRGYSVAQHCVLAADYCNEHEFVGVRPHHALLHDAHEALIGDIITPFVKLIDAMGENEDIAAIIEYIKYRWDHAIGIAAFGEYEVPDEKFADRLRTLEMRKLDAKLFDIESRNLFGKAAENHSFYPDESHLNISQNQLKPWDARYAEERFLNAFKYYIGEEQLLEQRMIFINHQLAKASGTA